MADTQVARGLQLALDMYEFGERMARSTLRRQHPNATDEQIDRLLASVEQDETGPLGY